MSFFGFHPLVERWFRGRFEAPTDPQRLGWPEISAGEDTLIAAPTGSGKTLTAFLAVIDRLLKDSIEGRLTDGMRVVYVSPLRALSNDMHRNLSEPLAELNALAASEFPDVPIAELRAGLRTGDTTAAQRAALVRRPPHILVTTPESLYLLLTGDRGREALRTTDTIIIDEIHSLIRDKRGSHLALSVERLEALCERRLQRIGLSATQKPIERVGQFLVGAHRLVADTESGNRSTQSAGWGSVRRAGSGGTSEFQDVSSGSHDGNTIQSVPGLPRIVDVGHSRDLDLAIEVPPSDLSAVCSTEQWGEVNSRIVELIQSHRATLIFVNTRRMAERLTHQLTELLGEDMVGSHHGSLATDRRLQTEQRLKDGQLKAVVATASLELGLDVGYIDLVIQIGSPRAIATFLQRIGRSGHSLGKTPKGRLFALTRDELLECMSLIRAVRAGRLDVVPIPENAIDVLAQQIVAEVSCREWDTDELLNLCRRAWPYRDLSREDFHETLKFLSEGLSDRTDRSRVYVHHDLVQKRVRARPGARIAATSNAGAIPEAAEFRVIAQPDNVVVGTLDEDFAVESHVGQIVLLGNTSWRMEGVRGTDVLVSDARGAPPTVPFWRGEAPGRTIELSEEVARLREDIETALKAMPQTVVATSWQQSESASAVSEPTVVAVETEHSPATSRVSGERIVSGSESAASDANPAALVTRLSQQTSASEHAARQAVDYVAAQIAAVGVVPTQKRVIFERFFDETGGMQMVVHAPFGSRITQAWGLAMRKRFCVSFDFELQATADDEGFILSLGPQHSFPLESMFPMLHRDNVRELLKQAILYIPMFQIRWRWNMNRALLVPRRDKGKRIPPALQRFRSDDLLTAVFPMLTGCQENVNGPLELPDHILLRQTMDDCLHEALDITGLEQILSRVAAGEIEFIARDTREPSPFSCELLNSSPYAFLDGGELAERRARAVATPRSLKMESASDLGRLDPQAIEQVVSEAQPLIRSADELHDLLLTRLLLREDELADGNSHGAGEQKQIPHQGAAIAESMSTWLSELVGQRRATRIVLSDAGGTGNGDAVTFLVAAERLPAVRAMFPKAQPDPDITVPDGARTDWTEVDARIAAVRGLIETSGPMTHLEAAVRVGLTARQAFSCLEALEGQGLVLRGQFRPRGGFRIEDDRARRDAVRQVEVDDSPAAAEGAPELRPDAAGLSDQTSESAVEWCHRRLLARIHRLTLDGLRQQIQPVPLSAYFQFLVRHHGLTPDSQRAGVNGLFEIISMLQGLDIPAASWERDILPSRLSGYRSDWLDELCLSGEVGWGRLFPPRRESESRAGVTRVVPISLFLRGDQDWLAESGPAAEETALTASASAAVELLSVSGASFMADLQQRLGLTAGTFQDVLGELITSGLVTADGFGGLRSLLAERGQTSSSRSRRRGLTRRRTATGAAGRWSLWRSPSPSEADLVKPLERSEVVEQWAWQLIRRWGVVFRDLLDRENGAPRWWELLQVYRRLEARGELRGGRFVQGVAGEQFALPDTVKRLRNLRDRFHGDRSQMPAGQRSSARLRQRFLSSLGGSSERDRGADATKDPADNQTAAAGWLVLSAADPLNLVGIVTEHARVPAFAHNRILFHNGRPVAALVGQETVFLERCSLELRDRMAEMLRTAAVGPVGELTDTVSASDGVLTADSISTPGADEALPDAADVSAGRSRHVRPVIQ